MTTQKKLTRSMSNRKIAGVCGGLGEYFNVDPLVFRIIFLVLLCGGGTGFILYLILWIVMPEDPILISNSNAKKTNFEEVVEEAIDDVFVGSSNRKCRRHSSGVFWGLLFVAFGLLWLGRTFGIFHFYWCNVFKLWPLLIIWIGVSMLPMARIWKNVCSVIILSIALVLIFILPSSSCHLRFWDDDFKYEIKKKFKDAEYTINEKITSEIVLKEIKITDEIKGVIIEGPWEVTITQDDSNNSATVEHNLPDSKVTTELRSNGYLHLKANGVSRCLSKTLNATISATSLEKIKASGAATIKAHGTFTSDCDISISGASKIDIHDLKLNRLKVNASGASHVYGNGYATETSIIGSGSSHLNMYDLESDNLTINLSGASSVEATVNQTIKGSLSGASSLRYKNAEDVSRVSTSGGSKVIQVK